MPKKNFPRPDEVGMHLVSATELTGAEITPPDMDYDPYLRRHLTREMQQRKPDKF
ncbi:MAG: hypothetical protein LBE35_01005 [Clostridiales bacterium]|jgi:hypothetical protein|nr:hypothetical protein [Clostridiales bacterium]